MRMVAWMLVVAGCFGCSGRAGRAVLATQAARRDACDSARDARAHAFEAVARADAALIAAQDALRETSRNGRRPNAPARAALYDLAQEDANRTSDQLRLAKDQAESASRAEESACQGF